jgi:hypothetical protein
MQAFGTAVPPPAFAQSLLGSTSAGSPAAGSGRGGGGSSPEPGPAPAPGPGSASSAPSVGGGGFGGYVALIALLALTIPALRRRMVLSPAGLGPAGFLSLLERPG